MADTPTGKVRLEVELIPRLERALADIKALSVAAVTDRGMPASERVKAIATEIALTRQLRDEEERRARGGGSIARRPAAGSDEAVLRRKADDELKALVRARTVNLPDPLKEQVLSQVGGKRKQQQYYERLQLEQAQARAREYGGPLTEAGIARALGEKQKEAQARAARLAGGRESEDFKESLLNLDVEIKRFYAAMEKMRLTSTDYIEAEIEGVVAHRQLTALVKVAAESEQVYIESTALLAESRRRLQQETILSLAGVSTKGLTPQQVQDRAAEEQRRLGITTATRQLAGVGPGETAERAALRAEQARLAAAVQEEANESSALAAAKARARIASAQSDTATRQEIREREEGVAALARNRITRQEETAAVNEVMRREIGSGRYGGTFRQRIQSAVDPTPRIPGLEPTGLQSLVGRGMRSFEFMLSGFASGAIIFGLIEAVKEAAKLQEAFAGLRGQLDELGRGTEFPAMRDGIRSISADTGVAAEQVTKFAERLVGLFSDPARALEETRAAMELSVVSGTDLNVMLEELVPVARAFGVGVTEIGDTAVMLHDKFGIAVSDTQQFLGSTAAVAKEAGYSLQSLAVVGAAAANTLGVSGNTAGQQFAKVIEQMRDNADKIVGIYRLRPETAQLSGPILGAFARGEGGEAFKEILRTFSQLDKQQQQMLVNVSGSRREWALLNGIFAHSTELLEQINEAERTAGSSSGALRKRFEEVANSLNQTVSRLQDLFKNLVEGIISSGAGDALGFILERLEEIFRAGHLLLTLFGQLNEKLKFGPFDQGLLAFLASAGVGLLIASKALSAYNQLKGQGARFTRDLALWEETLKAQTAGAAAAEEGETAALNRNTAATVRNAEASATLTAAERGQAGATGAAAGTTAATGFAGLWQRLTGFLSGQGAKGAAGGAGILSRLLPGGLGGISAEGAFGLGPITAGIVSGLVSTNWARDQFLEGSQSGLGGFITRGGPGLAKLESDVRESAQRMRTEDLQKMAEDHRTWWQRGLDRTQEAFFDVDMPTEIYQKELARREAAPAVQSLAGVDKAGMMKEFISGISDANLKLVSDWISQGGKDVGKWAEQQGLAQRDDYAARHLAGPVTYKPTVTRESLERALPGIRAAAERGDENAKAVVKWADDVLKNQGSLQGLRDDIQRSADTNLQDAIDKAGGLENYFTLFDPKGALETGQITPAEYLAQAEQWIADQRQRFAVAKDKEEAYKQLNQKLREVQQYRDQLILNRMESLNRQAEFESDTPAATQLARELATLPRLTITTQVDRLSKLQDLARKAYDERIEAISDPWERYRARTEGYQVPVEVQTLDLVDQLRTTKEWSAPILSLAAVQYGGATPENQDRIRKEVSETAAREGISIKQATVKYIQDNATLLRFAMGDWAYIALLQSVEGLPDISTDTTQTEKPGESEIKLERDLLKGRQAKISLARAGYGAQGRRQQARFDLQSANEKLAELNRERAIAEQYGIKGPTPDEIDEAQANVDTSLRNSANIEDEVAEAMANWEVIEAFGDTVRASHAKARIANDHAAAVLRRVGGDRLDPEFIKASQEARQAEIAAMQSEQDRALAIMDLYAVRLSRDPLQTAQAKVNRAQQVLSNAIANAQGNLGATEVIRAQQELAQAQLSLEDAINAGFEARANLAIALAEANGDTVRAAELAAQEAQRKLDQAIAQGITDDTVIAPLRGALATANANAKNVAISRQEEIIDFQQQMGYITVQQAIESLKLLLTQTREGTQQYEQLALKIHSLEQEAGQDLQFNLPTFLGLPTLYEARRLDQGTRAGIGYQDNRQIALVVNVNGAQDPTAVTNQVMAAFSSAMNAPATNSSLVGVGH